MAAVDDALFSARSAHYGVIATSVAAMLFATTPDLAVPYRAARLDLEALRHIAWDTGRTELINEAVKKRDDSLTLWLAFLKRANGGEPVYYPKNFFASDYAWESFPTLPVVTSQSSTVTQLIGLGSTGAVKIRRPTVLRDLPLHEIAPLCFPTAKKERGKTGCALEVQRKSDSTYNVVVTELGKHSHVFGTLRMDAADIAIDGLTMRNWIKRKYPNQQLFDSAANNSPFAPKLAIVQREISDLTLTQAAGVLEEQIAGHEQHMSALGFSAGGSFLTLVGPVLLILTLMYLSFQINHLAGLAHGNETAIRDFAWPLTFRGYPGTTTGVVTLLILPTAAVLLLRIHGDNTNTFSWRRLSGIETWGLLFLSVAAGIWCLAARSRLVRRTGSARSG
jgi:hypothetical protein